VVSGGAGFIGGAVVEKLRQRADDVVVVDCLTHGQIVPKGQFLNLDLREPDSSRRVRDLHPDVVVHLAALSNIPDCEDSPNSAFEHNVAATAHLCRELPAARFVFASSAAVYGTAAGAHHEDEACAPRSIYGVTKMLGEEIVKLHSLATGRRNQILRLGNVYGIGDYNAHVIPSIVSQVERGAGSLRLGNVKCARDWVWRDDVAEVIAAATRESFAHHTINVGTGRVLSVASLVDVVGQIVGRKLVVNTRTDLRRSVDPDIVALDTARLDALALRPQVPLQEGLAKMLGASLVGSSNRR